MQYQLSPQEIHLDSPIHKSQVLLEIYEAIELFQVLRIYNAYNSLIDSKENEVVLVEIGKVRINRQGRVG
jgi:hypothetical protein